MCRSHRSPRLVLRRVEQKRSEIRVAASTTAGNRPSGIVIDAMATAVPASSLPLPRRASPPARGPSTPSLRKRHCAVRPVAAAAAFSAPPPRQLDNG
jgi:hypothetical protein